MRSRSRSIVLVLLCIVPCILVPLLAVGQLDLGLELLTGLEVPDRPGYYLYSSFGGLKTNAAGRFVFTAIMRNEELEAGLLGVFVKEGDSIRTLLCKGESLPDGGGTFKDAYYQQPEVSLDINESGTIALAIRQGILIDDGAGLRWLARAGTQVPGTSLTIQQVAISHEGGAAVHREFLTESGVVTFVAQLSDGTESVLKASDAGLAPVLLVGQPLPGRNGMVLPPRAIFSQVTVRGEVAALVANYSISSGYGDYVFLQDATTLHTVSMRRDMLPGGEERQEVIEVSVNRHGVVVLAARAGPPYSGNNPVILKWSAQTGLSEAVNDSLRLSALPGVWPIELGAVSIDDQGRMFFGASFGTAPYHDRKVAILMMEEGRLEVIAVDGQPTPIGGVFRVKASSLEYPFMVPVYGEFEVTETNGQKEIAFLADAIGTDYTGVPFLWSGGELIPVPLQNRELPGVGQRVNDRGVVSAKSGLLLAQDGRLFINTSVCCEAAAALFSTQPLAPRVQYLPVFAAGKVDAFKYVSRIELVNQSCFAGSGTIDFLSASGEQPDFPPRRFLVEPGATTTVTLDNWGDLKRGYAKVTVEGGASISASLSLELGDGLELLSTAVLEALRPALLWEAEVDGEIADAAFAVANPQDVPGLMTLEFLDSEGQVVDTHSSTLSPMQQFSFLIRDVFHAAPAPFVGRLRVRCETPVLVAGLSLAGIRLSGIPVMPVAPSSPARTLTFRNLYPEPVKEAIKSQAETIAFITEDHRLIVIRGGEAYDVLAEGDFHAPPYQLRLVGFAPDDTLYFVANQDPSSLSPLSIYAWTPGRLQNLAGPPEWHINGFPAIDSKGRVVFATSRVSGNRILAIEIFRYDGAFARLFAIEGNIWVKSLRVSGDTIAILGDAANQELWLGHEGRVFKVFDRGAIQFPPTFGELQGVLHARPSPAGKVYFSAVLRDRTDAAHEWKTGLFVSDGVKTEKILIDWDQLPGLDDLSVRYLDNQISLEHPRFVPLAVNADDNLVIRTSLYDNSSRRSMAFLQVNGTTKEISLLYPPLERLGTPGYSPTDGRSFEWRDGNELVFQLDTSLGETLARLKDASLEVLFAGTITLGTFEGTRPSFGRRSPDTLLLGTGTPPMLNIEPPVTGLEPPGLYQARPPGFREYVFPTVTCLEGGSHEYRSGFLMHNPDTEDAEVKLFLYGSSGELRWTQQVTLAAGRTEVVMVEGLSPYDGWARVEMTGGDAVVHQRLQFFAGGELRSQMQLRPIVPRPKIVFAAPVSGAVQGAMAIVNPYRREQEVWVELVRPGWAIARQERVVIPANARKSFYLKELFGDDARTSGLVQVRSAWPVVVSSFSFNGLCMAPTLIY